MSLNQDAPPPPAPKSNSDFVKFDPFPKSDSYVLTVVAVNYIAECTFNRTDEKTKKKYEVIAPGVEWFLGTVIDGKPRFLKTWPRQYSLSDRANYFKEYSAIAGVAPTTASRPADLVGKFALVEVEVAPKVSAKGTAYTASNAKRIGKVPSILAATGTDIKALRPALDAILAGGDKNDEKPPF